MSSRNQRTIKQFFGRRVLCLFLIVPLLASELMMARYSETLLDQARWPRRATALSSANAVGSIALNGQAPRVTIYLEVQSGIVADAGFQAFGCGVVIACCSMLLELAVGRSINDCELITAKHLMEALEGIPTEKQFCATLAVAGLKNALRTAANAE